MEDKDRELAMREKDLRDIIARHQHDIETIMQRESGNLQDHMIKVMEGKIRDVNDVLEGKVSNCHLYF